MIAGDIFDSANPKAYVLEEFNKMLYRLDKMPKTGTLVLIAGNHDCDTRWSSLLAETFVGYRYVRVITEPRVIEGTLFIPHMPVTAATTSEVMREAVKEAKKHKPKFVVAHGQVAGAKTSSDVEIEAGNALEIDPYALLAPMGLVGHIHKQQELRFGAATKTPIRYFYPGSVTVCDFSEVDNVHGYMEFKGLKATFREFAFKQHEYGVIRVDLANKKTVDYDEAKLKALCENKLIKVIVYASDVNRVDEIEIRDRLSRFGTVVKFETVLCNTHGEMITIPDEFQMGAVNYPAALKSWLKAQSDYSVSQKKAAYSLGTRLIREAVNEDA